VATAIPLVRYARLDSPLGVVHVAATERGVCRLEIGMADREFVASSKERYHCWLTRDEEFMAPYLKQLGEYFEGRRKRFDFELDFLEGTEFQRKVWRALYAIPYGQVRSYKDVARTVGSLHGYRAVGAGCGANPVAIIIPCHRVVNQDGKLGGFGYGLEMKQRLLQLEGALL
jgi:methylated-DNA-[protein]-cysteine S-methyltransferase